jgi:hypothetical protein
LFLAIQREKFDRTNLRNWVIYPLYEWAVKTATIQPKPACAGFKIKGVLSLRFAPPGFGIIPETGFLPESFVLNRDLSQKPGFSPLNERNSIASPNVEKPIDRGIIGMVIIYKRKN